MKSGIQKFLMSYEFNRFIQSTLFILSVFIISTGNAYAACTTVNGPYSINSSSTDCYSWTSGDLTVAGSGSITPSNTNSHPIVTSGNVGTLTNNGSIISNNNAGGGEPISINNNVTEIINNGLIQNRALAFSIFVYKGTLSTLTNSGSIQNLGNSSGESTAAVGVAGAGWGGSGVIANLNNLSGGVISTFNAAAISAANGGIISNINNAGVISTSGDDRASIYGSGIKGSGIYNEDLMASISNTGSIYTTTSGAFGIYNSGIIGTLNNLQGAGNTHGALTYTGKLPTNYNVIINSSTNYGQLIGASVSADTMTFDIYSTSKVDSNTYTGVLSGISAANLTVTSGTFGSEAWQLVETSSGVWDLLFPNYSYSAEPVAAMSVFGATSSENRRAAFGAAQVIDANQALLDVFSDLNGDQEIADAAESTLPGVSGGVAQVTNTASNAVTSVVASRQGLIRGLSSGDDMMTDRHLWLKPFGGWTEQDTRQGVTGYNIDSYGLALGFDGDVSASWNVGFAFAYINSDVKSNLVSGSHNIDMDSYLTKVYATNMLDDVTALNLQFGAGVSDYKSNRRLFTGDVANADYDSWQIQASAELERSYSVSDKTVVTPYVHVDYSYVDVESYNETGAGALNLNVASDSADSLVVGAGIKADQTVSEKVLLMANAGIGYDLMTDRSSLTSSFAGGGANFTTEGIKPDEFVYNAGLGAKYSLENGTEITASYDFSGRQDYTDQSISANARFMF